MTYYYITLESEDLESARPRNEAMWVGLNDVISTFGTTSVTDTLENTNAGQFSIQVGEWVDISMDDGVCVCLCIYMHMCHHEHAQTHVCTHTHTHKHLVLVLTFVSECSCRSICVCVCIKEWLPSYIGANVLLWAVFIRIIVIHG